MTKYAVAFLVARICLASASASDDIDSRRIELLQREAEHPFPGTICSGPTDGGCIAGKLSQGLALMYLNRTSSEVAQANELIADAVTRISESQKHAITTYGVAQIDKDQFHFGSGPWLYHLEALFGKDALYRGRLEPRTSHAITELLYRWASTNCPLKDADPRTVWDIYGTENHETMFNNTCWGTADVLSRDSANRNLRYADGSTAEQQLAGWTRFMKTYLAERGRRGMFVEFYSQSYAPLSLQNVYTYSLLSKLL